jgi:hypothetical protein
MSEKDRNEKEEKDEKDSGESWDEKWRRDPVDAAGWALILIWAGLVLLAANLRWFGADGFEVWPWIFVGAGVIVLLGVLVRLVVPAYRRPVMGSVIFGAILLGIGLAQLPDLQEHWPVVLGVVLVVIGAGALLRGTFQQRE